MPQLMRLVESFPLQELWFSLTLLLAEFMVDKTVLD
jgi:hypothetical protein